ncbi:hypothetical protein COB57_05020 [Candidatus Peregrinibacteria bacterium]|nr:MAG: hypothetical protein COB57_05020 [Candidatus Peregrinibacteria bacterium]
MKRFFLPLIGFTLLMTLVLSVSAMSLSQVNGNANYSYNTTTKEVVGSFSSHVGNVTMKCSDFDFPIASMKLTVNGKTDTAVCDSTPPTCSVNITKSLWSKEPVEVIATCSDAESGCEQAETKKMISQTTKNGTLQIKDKAGNVLQCAFPNIYIDETPPNMMVVSDKNLTDIAEDGDKQMIFIKSYESVLLSVETDLLLSDLKSACPSLSPNKYQLTADQKSFQAGSTFWAFSNNKDCSFLLPAHRTSTVRNKLEPGLYPLSSLVNNAKTGMSFNFCTSGKTVLKAYSSLFDHGGIRSDDPNFPWGNGALGAELTCE